MIGLFPDLYANELLYSACGRYSDRMQYPSKMTVVRELLGSSSLKAVTDLPWHFETFLANLPLGHRYSFQGLANQHTLLPYYSPFLARQARDQLAEAMQSASGLNFYHDSGFVQAGIAYPTRLRYCPVCKIGDQDRVGEPYWHRLPQVPGVEVCPQHQVFLENSPISARKHYPVYEFVSAAREMPITVAMPLAFDNADHQVLLRIAQDAAWLLEQPYTAFCLEWTEQQYHRLLCEQYPAIQERICLYEVLVELVSAYYSPDLLQHLQCPIKGLRARDTWLFRLLFLKELRSPLHHLLLIQFLGLTVQQFFQPWLSKPDNLTLRSV
jgi:TniQ/Tn7-like transposition protein D